MIPKFRAFLTETKTIHDVLQIDLSRSMVSLKIENASEWYWFKEVVLMQSTGLKDKNGVEIFEGDLVKKFSNINKFTDDFAEDIEPIYVITSIVRDGACFKTTFKGVPSFVLDQNSMSMVEHMEVVGNIYENPELLETADES